MHGIEKVGRMSLAEIPRRRVFMSYIFCRDDRRQVVVVGARTPYFTNYGLRFVNGEITEKVHMSMALIRANTRGRMIPNQSDMSHQRPVRFEVLSEQEVASLNPSLVVDAYMYG